MTVLQMYRVSIGQVGEKPGSIKMVTSDNLATITTAGYLNGIGNQVTPSVQIAPSDVIECLYAYSPITDNGTLVFLQPLIVNGVITLVAWDNPSSEPLTDGHIFVGNASNVATDVAMSGDIAITNAGVTSISAGVIVNADVKADAAIAYSKLAALNSAQILVGSAGNVATAVAVTGDIAITNAGVTSIASGVIVDADVKADAAIAYSKLATLTSGNILVGSAGNVATSVALSGDATMSDTGAITLASNAVTSSRMSPLLMKYASVSMSSAEFKGAYAAPKLLVAAGGADTLLVLESVQVLMTYGTTQYANGGVAHIQYDSTANGAGIIASSTQAAANFFDAASTALGFNQGVVKQPFTTAVNKGLYFSNVTGAFDTGDSNFIVHIWYRIIPTV